MKTKKTKSLYFLNDKIEVLGILDNHASDLVEITTLEFLSTRMKKSKMLLNYQDTGILLARS